MPISYATHKTIVTTLTAAVMMKKMIMCVWRGRERKKKKKRDDNFKIRAKTRRQTKMMMMMKNMVQVHDDQRSIQMTISDRNTHKNTAQTSTVIINNGGKNSKCRPTEEAATMRTVQIIIACTKVRERSWVHKY